MSIYKNLACSVCGHLCEQESRQESVPFIQDYQNLIQKYSNTNQPPSDLESSQLRLALTDEVKKLADIDLSIENLRQQYRKFASQRAATRQHADNYKTILHPIRRVPADVLYAIFLLCINESLPMTTGSSFDTFDISIRPQSAIWSIPLVSRAWRAVALSFPRLWSNIRIPNAALSVSNIDRRKVNSPYRLTVQLGRAGSYPLSVGMSCYSRVENMALFQVLSATSDRWKSLYARLNLSAFGLLSTYTTASFPLLTEAHVEVITDESGGNGLSEIRSSTLPRIFKSCLNLKTLRIDSRYLPFMVLPYRNIETFSDIGTLSYTTDCIIALKLLPCLRFFETKCRDITMEPEVFKTPCLESLTVLGNDQPVQLLECLITPSLQHLKLTGLNGSECLLAFLGSQSDCKIESLELEGNLDEMYCIRILKGIPMLERLTLRRSVFAERIVEQLMIAHDDKPVFVPLLKILELRGNMEGPFPGVDRLKEMRPQLALMM